MSTNELENLFLVLDREKLTNLRVKAPTHGFIYSMFQFLKLPSTDFYSAGSN